MRPDPYGPPPVATPYHVISLGAGVQSSTMALMAAHGEIGPRPDAAIFADTQSEPASVYRWLDWLESAIAAAPYLFPVHRVTAGNLGEKALSMRVTKDGRRYSRCDLPVYTRNADGGKGLVQRKCTYDFKLRPIWKEARRIAGVRRARKGQAPLVTQWIGISWDELQRVRDHADPSQPWAQRRYPLVELRMRRGDCLRWMEHRGYPLPPRSACVFCPFHSDKEWRRLKVEEPDAFAAAVRFEAELQRAKAEQNDFRSVPFLHSSLRPLAEVDLSSAEDAGQVPLFLGECEGMCGV